MKKPVSKDKNKKKKVEAKVAPKKAAKKPAPAPKVQAKKAAPKAAPTKKAADKKPQKPVAKVEAKKAEPIKAKSAPAKPIPVAKAKKEAKPVEPKKDSKAKEAAQKKGKKKEGDLDEEFLLDDVGDDSELLGLEAELKAIESEDEGEETAFDAEESEDTYSSKKDSEVVLTDAEGRRYCRVRDCDQAAVVDAYCRHHYLLLWKKIQVRKKILIDGKLERYVEELTSRYPDKFLEMLKKDLKTEKDFLNAIQELEIDESAIENDFEEETQSYIDEVRGISDTGVSSEEEEF